MKKFLRVTEIAKITGKQRSTVSKWVQAGRFGQALYEHVCLGDQLRAGDKFEGLCQFAARSAETDRRAGHQAGRGGHGDPDLVRLPGFHKIYGRAQNQGGPLERRRRSRNALARQEGNG